MEGGGRKGTRMTTQPLPESTLLGLRACPQCSQRLVSSLKKGITSAGLKQPRLRSGYANVPMCQCANAANAAKRDGKEKELGSSAAGCIMATWRSLVVCGPTSSTVLGLFWPAYSWSQQTATSRLGVKNKGVDSDTAHVNTDRNTTHQPTMMTPLPPRLYEGTIAAAG